MIAFCEAWIFNSDRFSEQALVYEETPDVRKEAVLREGVNVTKETNRETVDAEAQIRREKLDVTTTGHPTVDKRPDPLPDERR